MKNTVGEAEYLPLVTNNRLAAFDVKVTYKNIRKEVIDMLQHGHSLIYISGLERVCMPLKIPI